MALNNLPIILSGYRVMVSEAPAIKMRREGETEVPVIDRTTNQPAYIVELLVKPVARPGERAGKGEVIRVTLPYAPAEEIEDGDYVELVNPTVSYYEVEDRVTGRKNSGLSFRAETLKPVRRAAAA